ncbi:MAG: peptide chain release factor N(5)-glutamine methyltransferase [Streptosporangiales bacterium]
MLHDHRSGGWNAVREQVGDATRRLTAAGVASPRTDAEILAANVLDVPRARVALAGGFTSAQAAAYGSLVERRAAGEPLQHITGVAGFRRLELAVGPGVFVPRPETEVLVDWALADLQGRGGAPVVVDLCTGTGAVALAIATEHPSASVHAVESADEAYAWARHNLADAPVRLHHADAASCLAELDAGVDLVVANPPYVPAGTQLPPEVRHDPAAALFAGADGLDGVRTVAHTASRLLRPGGALACEHDALHGESAPAVLASLPYWERVEDHRDLAGRPRFVTAYRTAESYLP